MTMIGTFRPGQSVALKSGTQLETVTEWKTPGVGVSIVMRQNPEMVAPHAVWFEAVLVGSNLPVRGADGNVIYDPHFHDYLYQWDFGDHGAYTVAQLRDPVPAINTALGKSLPLMMDRGVAEGQLAMHVFGAPGTYTVTLTVRSRTGIVATASETITVADPDVMFAGDKTIVVSKTSSFTGAPAGARQVTSFLSAISLQKTLGTTARILLKRGEDYFSEGRPRLESNGLLNFYVGAWGAGARPRLWGIWPKHVGDGGVIMRDIELWSSWDETTETGNGESQFYLNGADCYATLYRCTSTGAGAAVYTTNGTANMVLAVFDCHITNWSNFGVLLDSQGRTAFSGVSIKRSPLALGGGGNKGQASNQHGCMRWSPGYDDTLYAAGVFRHFDWFNNAGWSTANGLPAYQACFRTSGGVPAHYLILTRGIMECGSAILSDTASSALRRPQNNLLDKLLIIGSAAGNGQLNVGFGGSEVRNVITIQPDAKKLNYTFDNAFGSSELSVPDDPQNVLEPVKYYNNSFVSWMDVNPDASGSSIINVQDWQKAEVANNIEHGPGHIVPINAGDFDDTVAFAPIYQSMQWRPSRVETIDGVEVRVFDPATAPDTSYATPLNTVRLPIPLPGNPNIGAAEVGKPVAIDDFFGRIRPLEGATKGAIEPV